MTTKIISICAMWIGVYLIATYAGIEVAVGVALFVAGSHLS